MPFGVGRYCFIHSKGNARASYKDKADSVPTSFLFMAHFREQMSANILIMTKMQYNGEDPQLSEFFVILIVLVVIGIAAWLFS